MGAKSSRVQAVTVGSTEKVIHAPASEVSASAPPTPEHPDGAPRGEENAQVDNYFPMPMPMPGQVTKKYWMRPAAAVAVAAPLQAAVAVPKARPTPPH
eukprot:CAMPEP_0206499030 /NCGR_PEP_ID=MMETSP0324_2-20121206/51441_1 /ASSEMBLY_ACC=CAM_ASM_000836 /TAXON_ID=2866 /ORGANISM="Crypthecodinium cohnii, Strain Seligo" /LENGTH=97 /DNA_ID=CAMNT_0053985519 /DNA_START=171 /DNA_END=464 /DNA_ORIENTATION=+